MFIRNSILAAMSAMSIAALAAPASAAPAGQAIRVEYSDLNLTTAEGQATLDRRLDDAARQVCGIGAMQTGTRMESRDARRCYREAKTSLAQQFANLVQAPAKG